MKLDFKGIITKEALKKDINNLDEIMNENDYAIVVDNGVGKFVIFDMDYVKYRLELKDESKSGNKLKKSPFTLVESMIQTLEEIPEKKTTAIILSSLVKKYYGRSVSPVIIRTRAEENANNQGSVNYFKVEPENIIGLTDNSDFDFFIYNKVKHTIENVLNNSFKNTNRIEVNKIILQIHRALKSTLYLKYKKELANYDIKDIIESIGLFKLSDNYITIKE